MHLWVCFDREESTKDTIRLPRAQPPFVPFDPDRLVNVIMADKERIEKLEFEPGKIRLLQLYFGSEAVNSYAGH